LTHSTGILAYGSLIDDPGVELEPHIIARIDCWTPFPVEFARSSTSRKADRRSCPPRAAHRQSTKAINRLYRRELHKVGSDTVYSPPAKANLNTVLVKKLLHFEGIDTVIYTSIGANISDLSAEKLARLAVGSAKNMTDGRDGISYLVNAMSLNLPALLPSPLTSWLSDILSVGPLLKVALTEKQSNIMSALRRMG
jgi:hypothetical protein